MIFLIALLIAALGAAPMLFRGRKWSVLVTFAINLAWAWPVLYWVKPSMAPPLWGAVGIMLVVAWTLGAVVDGLLEEDVTWLAWVPICGVLLIGGRACTGCAAFRASDYAEMIGPVEERVWTEDVQPADPRHIRLVPHEMALWLGNKQLGEASGAIGSQFQIESEGLTLQRIKGELWYVAPLEFRGWGAWRSAKVSRGYVMIHGEDPERKPIVKTDEKFVYTPGAYWGHNLTRHLQDSGYRSDGITDYSLEIDEAGKAWWIATIYEYTIGWGGKKVRGITVVDPTTGEETFYAVGSVPDWVDRVFPKSFIKTYIEDWGKYQEGWLNSWLWEKDVKAPEEPSLVYGSDGEPYWVTGITSSNSADEALIGLIYTDVRTGVSTFYRASGGTDAAVLQAVDNKVSYKRQHGASPVIYNVNGTMASVVPLLGVNHTYQGVAIVNIERPQDVAVGENLQQALREYKRLMARSGASDSIAADADAQSASGTVLRFAAETTEGKTAYFLKLDGTPKIFTAGGEISPKLALTVPGDKVDVTYYASEDQVITMITFDNLSLPLEGTAPPTPKAEETPDAAP